jgi:hypothetical protein
MKERDAYPDTSGGPVVWDGNVDFGEGPGLPSGRIVGAGSDTSEHLRRNMSWIDGEGTRWVYVQQAWGEV